MGNPVLVLNNKPSMDARIGSILELPSAVFRMMNYDKADQHGSTPTVANGIMIPATPEMSNITQGLVDPPVQVATGSASVTVLQNRLFLVPKHDALNVSAFNVTFSIKLYGSSISGGIFYIDKFDAILVKITAAGTETVLRTITNTYTFSLSQAPDTWFGLGVTDEFSAISIAATERLGIRIKTYGHFSTTGFTMGHIWGGTYASYCSFKFN